jgi:hypothetical protein
VIGNRGTLLFSPFDVIPLTQIQNLIQLHFVTLYEQKFATTLHTLHM